MKPLYILLATTIVCPTLRPASGTQGGVPTTASHGQTIDWDAAFHDDSGSTPLHLTAHYIDSRNQTHRLEEWRTGQTHLRRKTDDRIDLHADAVGKALPNQPRDYVWQILDLQTHIAHRVSTAGMLHLGMLYSYYSMAHLLTRPPGRFSVQQAAAPVDSSSANAHPEGARTNLGPCAWFQVDAPGQPSIRVCWLARYGVPARIWSQSPTGWRQTFQVDTLDTRPIPASVFTCDTFGFQVRNVDEIESED